MSSSTPLALALSAVVAFATAGCGGGVSAAPLDPLAGSAPAAFARETGRQPVNGTNANGDDSTATPAKSIGRGPREKHYKGG
jgi:hypothetical protein